MDANVDFATTVYIVKQRMTDFEQDPAPVLGSRAFETPATPAAAAEAISHYAVHVGKCFATYELNARGFDAVLVSFVDNDLGLDEVLAELREAVTAAHHAGSFT